MANDLITRMRQSARSQAAVFVMCVDDYRTFVTEWLAAPGPLREPVPTGFENIPIVVMINASHSYVLTGYEPPEMGRL